MTRSCRILYVTHRVPYPPDKGDRIRTFHTLRYLAKTHRVYLACLADEPVSTETHQTLSNLCEQVAIVPIKAGGMRKLRMAWSIMSGGIASVTAFHSKKLSSIIESWAKEIDFDLAISSSSGTTAYLDTACLRTIPAVVDLVDVDSEKWLNYSSTTSFPKSWIYHREGTALRKYEKHISSWAKAILVVSEAESQLFRKVAPAAPIHTVTNGVDLEYFQPNHDQTTERLCVFVGALDYLPNVDAVCWFASKVWPTIRRKHADAIFQIVGRRPTAAVQSLAQIPGVEVIGQVPDVRPFVHRSSIVVAPLRIARGLQNKVLEALAMAKPVVASPAALAGLLRDTMNPALQVSTEQEWVNTLEQLFSDREHREELGKQGREYVESHYHWNQCLEPLQHLIESLPDQHNSSPKPRTPLISSGVGIPDSGAPLHTHS